MNDETIDLAELTHHCVLGAAGIVTGIVLGTFAFSAVRWVRHRVVKRRSPR